MPSLEKFYNGLLLDILRFILDFYCNYFFREKNHDISVAEVVQGLLTQNSTNNIAKTRYFNSYMISKIKITKNKRYN